MSGNQSNGEGVAVLVPPQPRPLVRRKQFRDSEAKEIEVLGAWDRGIEPHERIESASYGFSAYAA